MASLSKSQISSGLRRGGTTSQAAQSRLKGTSTSVKYSSPSVKANGTGQYGATPGVPAAGPGNINDINAYLGGDSGYQDQLRQLAKALADFNADVTRRRGSLESDYGVSKKAMEDQKVKDLEALEDDFASRGLIRSGLYADAVGDYNTEFGQRMSDLDRRQQQALQLLLQEQSQYQSQNSLEQQRAREEAIRRRAETLGV